MVARPCLELSAQRLSEIFHTVLQGGVTWPCPAFPPPQLCLVCYSKFAFLPRSTSILTHRFRLQRRIDEQRITYSIVSISLTVTQWVQLCICLAKDNQDFIPESCNSAVCKPRRDERKVHITGKPRQAGICAAGEDISIILRGKTECIFRLSIELRRRIDVVRLSVSSWTMALYFLP